jgi:hypothetical protein
MSTQTENQETESTYLHQYAFFVISRGIVQAGRCVSDDGVTMIIKDAVTIRNWGTTKGLGQICQGPREETVLDPVSTVIVSKHSFIEAYTDLNQEVWERTCKEINEPDFQHLDN